MKSDSGLKQSLWDKTSITKRPWILRKKLPTV